MVTLCTASPTLLPRRVGEADARPKRRMASLAVVPARLMVDLEGRGQENLLINEAPESNLHRMESYNTISQGGDLRCTEVPSTPASLLRSPRARQRALFTARSCCILPRGTDIAPREHSVPHRGRASPSIHTSRCQTSLGPLCSLHSEASILCPRQMSCAHVRGI